VLRLCVQDTSRFPSKRLPMNVFLFFSARDRRVSGFLDHFRVSVRSGTIPEIAGCFDM
jgi:hypothetical protein